MRKLVLTEKTIIRYEDKEPVIVTDDKLELKIVSKYDLSHAVVSLKNGNQTAMMTYSKTITVPRELLFTGALYVVVELFADGKVIKKWQVEPLLIREHEAGFELASWCEDLTERVSALEEKTKIIL